MKISVALLRRKFFRSEDFSKFGICLSRFLLPCCIAPRILVRRKGACEFQCCVGSILGRKTSQNWIGVFQDSCCTVAYSPEIYVWEKGRVNISVALLRRKLFGLEDFSKFGICVSRFLLRCCVEPRNLGRKRWACKNQCCIVASEAF